MMLLELLIAGQLQTYEPKPEPEVKETPIVQIIEIEPVIETAPVEPTLEEKIKNNHYGCDTNTQYIRADNAQCLAKPIQAPVSNKKAVVRPQKRSQNVAGNTYEAGQCVWAVKNWRPDIPNGWGSAHSWLRNARAAGWSTGSTPRVGAVGVRGNHVVLITGVSGNKVTYKDMNGRYIPFEVGTGSKPASYYTYIY